MPQWLVPTSADAASGPARKRRTLLLAVALFALIGYFDYAYFDVSLGLLYILPVVIAATVCGRLEVAAVALLCAAFRHLFIPVVSPMEGALRFLLAFAAYLGGGLMVVEMARNRRLAEAHAEELEAETKLRTEAQEHLRQLAESSPAAIFTADERGMLLTYNRAAVEMFGMDDRSPSGGVANAGDFLPVLRDALKPETRAPGLRTAAQCRGRRDNGEPFIAQVWFSVYESPAGRRLAAIAVDSSEDVREREERNLRHVLDNNRIIAGAVSHEIRNVCGAISMVYSNLQRDRSRYGVLESAEDFRALGSLVEGLNKIASSDLQARVKRTITPVVLAEVLDDIRVVVEPPWTEADGAVRWIVPNGLPPVFVDPFGLTQAMLNLAQNSLRAVQNRDVKELTIEVRRDGRHVAVSVSDSGPGIKNPANLFEPFQRASEQTGLGLYVSRALLRSFGGDLKYEPEQGRCRFVAYLLTASGLGAAASPSAAASPMGETTK
ncbi:MAG: PAS domain-containing sensor histidine kinase [Acidobacteria bacterium]|nr:PAS domain-containing sensor histidine kinase [Acidobacteriota bacterium]